MGRITIPPPYKIVYFAKAITSSTVNIPLLSTTIYWKDFSDESGNGQYMLLLNRSIV